MDPQRFWWISHPGRNGQAQQRWRRGPPGGSSAPGNGLGGYNLPGGGYTTPGAHGSQNVHGGTTTSGSSMSPAFGVLFGLFIMVLVAIGGFAYAASNSPHGLALSAPVTLHQMGVRDHSSTTVVYTGDGTTTNNTADIVFRIHTANSSKYTYNIKYCEPTYIYLWDMSYCVQYKVGAHSAVNTVMKKRVNVMYGFALPHNVVTDRNGNIVLTTTKMPGDHGEITAINAHNIKYGNTYTAK